MLLGMPVETINLAATNESLYSALTFATNHLPGADDGIERIYDTYPLLSSEDNETRTIAATEVATAWWFASTAFYEADQHARYANLAGR